MPYLQTTLKYSSNSIKSKSLLVNKGFKSMGIESVLEKINKRKKEIPLGISIGATNKSYKDIEEMTKDIIAIMNVYVAKINGLRKYKKMIKEEIAKN